MAQEVNGWLKVQEFIHYPQETFLMSSFLALESWGSSAGCLWLSAHRLHAVKVLTRAVVTSRLNLGGPTSKLTHMAVGRDISSLHMGLYIESSSQCGSWSLFVNCHILSCEVRGCGQVEGVTGEVCRLQKPLTWIYICPYLKSDHLAPIQNAASSRHIKLLSILADNSFIPPTNEWDANL